jgi:spermidine synthase
LPLSWAVSRSEAVISVAWPTEHPSLVLYPLLEIGIGLYCLVIPFLLTLIRDIYPSFFGTVPGGVPVRTLLQFTVAFFVRIIPTTLMGGTLPSVCRVLVDSSHGGRAKSRFPLRC